MEKSKQSASLKASDRIRRLLESRLFSQLLPAVFLLLLVLFFSIATNGRFSSLVSLKIILDQALIVGTVATGAAFVFATGNVSLSMGATTVLTATIAGMAYNATGSIAVMVLVSLALSVFIMVVSALLSTLLGVKVRFVTIVMMSLLVAIQQSILGGSTVSMPGDLLTALTGNNFSYIAFALFFAVSIALFNFTDIGRALRMIGTNEVCSEQTGIEKKKYLMIAFIIGGIGCGIGALLAIVRAGSIGQNTLGSLNMDCMLAIVLGGMSIFGGSRSYVYSGIIGAVTVVALSQGLLMIGVDSSIIQGLRGVVFLVLVTVSQKRPHGLPAPEG